MGVRQGLRSLGCELAGILATRAPMCSRLACCASSRVWRETGAGWMSVSRAYLARSKRWLVKISLRATDDGARHWPDRLERNGGRDLHWRRVLERPRLRHLAWTGAEADIDR